MDYPTKRYYKMKALRKAFKKVGVYTGNNLIYFTTKIRRWEASGRFRSEKDAKTGHRWFTKKQINQIVRNFTPGGIGVWYYDDPKTHKYHYPEKVKPNVDK